jgi:hypothetical protein
MHATLRVLVTPVHSWRKSHFESWPSCEWSKIYTWYVHDMVIYPSLEDEQFLFVSWEPHFAINPSRVGKRTTCLLFSNKREQESRELIWVVTQHAPICSLAPGSAPSPSKAAAYHCLLADSNFQVWPGLRFGESDIPFIFLVLYLLYVQHCPIHSPP